MFLIGGDGVKGVGNGFSGGLAKTDFDRNGFLEGPLGQALDFGGNGGGEKESLPFFGAEGDNAFDVGQKSHIEHAVHFIKDEVSEVRKVKVALADEVEEASGGSDKDIDAPLDLFPLGAVANAPVDESNAQAGMARKFLESFRNLIGEFAGGFEDESAELTGLNEVLQDRQGKGGSFARTGLGRANDVFSGQSDGDGLRLDGGRLFVAEVLGCLEDRFRKAEGSEIH